VAELLVEISYKVWQSTEWYSSSAYFLHNCTMSQWSTSCLISSD